MKKFSGNDFFWALVALAPLAMIAGSYLTDHWTWGLMDDLGMLARSGTWWQRCTSLFATMFSAGSCRPMFAPYVATFYPFFKTSPQSFYFFKLFLTSGTLLLWGLSARALTKQHVSLFLVPAIALSFPFFYDTFAYLSIQEPQGMFFLGLAVYFLVKGCVLPVAENQPLRFSFLIPGILFLLLSGLNKEIFSVSVFAFGIAMAFWALIYRRASLLWSALGVVILSAAYLVYLKFFFAHAYSSRYDMKDIGTIINNWHLWLHQSAVYHLPWGILLVLAIFSGVKNKRPVCPEPAAAFGVIAGILFYASFLLLLLPWQVTDFYVIPLGVFFAFGSSMILGNFLSCCGLWLGRVLVVLALCLNILVCQYSFGKMAAYRNDTAQLIDWMEHNQQFHQDMAAGFIGATNAQEAGDTIPQLLNKQAGISVPSFSFLYQVKDIMSAPKVVYYLYNPKLGDQDLRRINMMWSEVYSSRSWILFRRIFWIKS